MQRLVFLIILLLFFSVANAHSTLRGAWASDGAGDTAASTHSPQGFVARTAAWIIAKQRLFHETLIVRLRALSREGGATAALYLIGASFLYGVFHAAGPGHGKVVIATYLITQRELLRRGVLLAALSALLQGIVALTLVYGLIYAFAWVPREVQGAVSWSERISYLIVSLFGLMLVWRVLPRSFRQLPAHIVPFPFLRAHHHRHDDATCDHTHLPSPDRLERAGNWHAAIGVVFSVGMRPCSGAVLVLVLAQAMALPWSGAAAVMAMSGGTALAVALLALVAVSTAGIARRLVSTTGLRTVFAGKLVALAGGLVLLWLGISLVLASFRPAHPLGF